MGDGRDQVGLTDNQRSEDSTGGGCLCGAVTFTVVGPLRTVSNCHCEPCRRFTGHHMAATAAAAADVRFNDDATLTWFRSAPRVEYGFCSRCGASLFWRCLDRPAALSIGAGVIDHPTGLVTDTVLFAAEHGDYHTAEPADAVFAGDRPSD